MIHWKIDNEWDNRKHKRYLWRDRRMDLMEVKKWVVNITMVHDRKIIDSFDEWIKLLEGSD